MFCLVLFVLLTATSPQLALDAPSVDFGEVAASTALGGFEGQTLVIRLG